MPGPFKASLITPEAIILETSVTSAQVPAFDGLVGILEHRAPLLAKLGTGVLTLDTTAGTQQFVVIGGYAQMKGDELTILTTEAIPADKVTPQLVAAEQARLATVTGVDTESMEKRQTIQARVMAMRSLTAA